MSMLSMRSTASAAKFYKTTGASVLKSVKIETMKWSNFKEFVGRTSVRQKFVFIKEDVVLGYEHGSPKDEVHFFNLDQQLKTYQTETCGSNVLQGLAQELIDAMNIAFKHNQILVVYTGKRSLKDIAYDEIFTEDFWSEYYK